MTTLFTALNTINRMNFANYNGVIYLADDFDPILVATAATGYNAGIAGPTNTPVGNAGAALGGMTTPGTHLMRYRYQNSQTGYVSNPSVAASITSTSINATLEFSVGAVGSGDDVIISSDPKVDTILIELTTISDATFYVYPTSFPNTVPGGGILEMSQPDAVLIQGVNADSLYGAASTFDLMSHEVPQALGDVAAIRNRMFYGVDYPYALTGVTVNSGATSFTGTGFIAQWVGRLLNPGPGSAAYQIATINSTLTAGTLTSVYAGATATGAASVYVKLPNRGYYSRLNFPEECYAAGYARDFLGGRPDRMRAMYPRPDGLYVFGAFSSERLAFQSDPSAVSSALYPILGNRGTLNKRCLVEAEGSLFAWDAAGIYRVEQIPVPVSEPIDQSLREMVDFTQFTSFHGVYDPIDRTLMWFFTAIGDTAPHYCVCKEFFTDRWFFYYFQQGITCSQQIAGTDGQVRAWLGDSNGYTWAFGVTGTFDGVPPSQTASCTLLLAGSTTSIINVNQALNTALGNAGASVYIPATGDLRFVTSNTSSAITLNAPLSVLPADGSAVWLGMIPITYTSKLWQGASAADKKSPDTFDMTFYPGTTTGYANVYFYQDVSATPVAYVKDSSYVLPSGVDIVGGALQITLAGGGNNTGYISVPMPSDWNRSIQFQIIQQIPDGPFRLIDCGFHTETTEAAPNRTE